MESPQPEKNIFVLSHKPTRASEVHEKQLGSSSSTEGPPGQTLGSWVCGADGAGNKGRRGHSGKLVVPLGRCLQIPEASRFLPGARAGLALLFGRIQRRDGANHGPGRRDRGAGHSGSRRTSGGHPSCRAAREEGRSMVVFFAGRAVALALEAERAVVLWIQGSAGAPSHRRSCEHLDDPTERRGRKGECQVFARSGLNSIGTLFSDSQYMRE